MNVSLECAVCGAAWKSSRSRASHEIKRHPDWRPSQELFLERRRDSLNRWRRKKPRSWRFLAAANQQATKYGLAHLPLGTELAAGPCAYCGGSAETWDHVVPLSRGGAHTVANLAPSCYHCNHVKSARPADEIRRPITLLCGWCWKPLTRLICDLRGSEWVACREHVNKLRCNPLPFGTPSFSRRSSVYLHPVQRELFGDVA